MRNKPELSFFKRSLIATLSFTATAIVFAIAIGLSPILILFYIAYNVYNNIKNKGNVAHNPWAVKDKVSLSHPKVS